MDRAEQMREAAAKALKSATGFDEDHPAVGAIRALPLPPEPPLDAEVAGAIATLRRLSMTWPYADLIERLAARAENAEAEVARLRHEIHEASDPDFLFGAMDNVNDMDANMTTFADAASRAIRAALTPKGADHGQT